MFRAFTFEYGLSPSVVPLSGRLAQTTSFNRERLQSQVKILSLERPDSARQGPSRNKCIRFYAVCELYLTLLIVFSQQRLVDGDRRLSALGGRNDGQLNGAGGVAGDEEMGHVGHLVFSDGHAAGLLKGAAELSGERGAGDRDIAAPQTQQQRDIARRLSRRHSVSETTNPTDATDTPFRLKP